MQHQRADQLNIAAMNASPHVRQDVTLVEEHSTTLRWYALHTRSNHEKRVAEQLSGHEVEHFLPLYRSIRQWKDRRTNLQLPLFPGYVFVRMSLYDRLAVQRIPGVAHLVGFCGVPAPLPESEIDTLRKSLLSGLEAEPCPYFHCDLAVGDRVRIVSGALKGFEAIVLEHRSKRHIIISLDLIQRSVRVSLDRAMVESIDNYSTC